MINPLDFLNVSKELLNTNRDESYRRTSISRAYYAVYLYAREKHFSIKRDNSIYREHAKIIRELKNDSRMDFRKLGNQLFDLKRDREDADYEIRKNINITSANKVYSQALRIKDTIDRI